MASHRAEIPLSFPLLSQPVVHGLLTLFKALSENERLAKSIDPESNAAMEAVDPSILREALDAQSGQRFRIGEMNDPSEVLSVILNDLASSRHLIDTSRIPRIIKVFGLNLSEKLICDRCGVTSHVMEAHMEFFHITSSSGLRFVASCEGKKSTVALLHDLEDQNQKMCDKDIKGCGKLGVPSKTLEKLPDVFTLQVAWEPSVKVDEINETLDLIDTVVRPDMMRSNKLLSWDILWLTSLSSSFLLLALRLI